MKLIKRLSLFLLINFLVIATISLIVSFFHLGPAISGFGLDVKSLLIFCLLWGMAGSLFSLIFSKQIAKWMMGIRIIRPDTSNSEELALYNMIFHLSQAAGLSKAPEIGIYESNEVNAFATGPTKRHSLIAVSSGLVRRMEQEEIKAVLAHEISHVGNGDMVTMTLLQGIINAFVMFLARILAYLLTASNRNRNNTFSYGTYNLLVFLFQSIFMIFGYMGICAFSRYREYRADFGGAKLAGKENMINALNSLRVMQEIKDPLPQTAALNAFKISNFSKKSLVLFSTHPSLEDRIERLKNSF